MSVGCAALKLILKQFAPTIKTNITAPPGIGVDISREERYTITFIFFNGFNCIYYIKWLCLPIYFDFNLY